MAYSQKKVLDAIIEGIREKKGQNIVDLNLKKLSYAMCDHFVICNAESNTQLEAISESVIRKVKEKTKARPKQVEGVQAGEWVLLDYFDIIVHIFQTSIRERYDIEGLWTEAKRTEIED